MFVKLPSRLLGALAVAGLLAAGCSQAVATPSPQPTSTAAKIPTAVLNREPLYACGTETATTADGPYNADGRSCFWNRYQNKQPAEFIAASTNTTYGKTSMTVTYYRTFEDGHVDIIVDGSGLATVQGWYLRHCAGLQLDESMGPPTVTMFSGLDPCTSTQLK